MISFAAATLPYPFDAAKLKDKSYKPETMDNASFMRIEFNKGQGEVAESYSVLNMYFSIGQKANDNRYSIHLKNYYPQSKIIKNRSGLWMINNSFTFNKKLKSKYSEEFWKNPDFPKDVPYDFDRLRKLKLKKRAAMKPSPCLLVFFSFQTLFGFSQYSHHLVISDAVSRKGIPYATIKVLNKPDGTYADESGRFEVNILAKDSLRVTCVGYQSKTVVPQRDTIFLDPVAVNLGEVKVRSKRPKEYAVGLAESKRDGTLFLCGHVNVENALLIRIPDSFTYYRIKGVKFNARHRDGISPVRLHIYRQGKDEMPDKELLPGDVIINRHLKSNDLIDLSHFNLILNDRIIYNICRSRGNSVQNEFQLSQRRVYRFWFYIRSEGATDLSKNNSRPKILVATGQNSMARRQ